MTSVEHIFDGDLFQGPRCETSVRILDLIPAKGWNAVFLTDSNDSEPIQVAPVVAWAHIECNEFETFRRVEGMVAVPGEPFLQFVNDVEEFASYVQDEDDLDEWRQYAKNAERC